MSKLISGKEALIALANGEEVETCLGGEWLNSDHVKALQVERIIENYYNFRLKPRTITINGVEYIDKQGAYEAFMEAYNEMDIHPDI